MPRSPKILRGTDENFLQLMQLTGAGLLKLAGFDAKLAEIYQFRAVELKEKQLQRPDVEGIPVIDIANKKRVTLEFQGYSDPYIRYRCLSNMLRMSLTNQDGIKITGIIVYTDKKYQEAALPFSEILDGFSPENNFIQEIVLTDYTEEQLIAIDPHLVMLAPFTISEKLDVPQFQLKVKNWYKQLNDLYPDISKLNKALDIVGLFLLNRFRYLTQEEVINMLNLDLLDTRAGQDLYRMGMTEGEVKGEARGKAIGEARGKAIGELKGQRIALVNLLKKRFGKLPKTAEAKIKKATSAELEQWILNVLDAKTIDNVFQELE
ncbi:DUF2887 domain-containing protein [Thioflexithrix psekupsensis]|uniref:DUF4351 domain-containing protein n=1 Tax=Thioflexithrix psekupsensis TaxID=1570016 RepID=A0A251XAX4_9GAMM|nr:DUF2887 domain-containing protein [Thioflexithrix psekupsensis]OUD15250.1 hypothetical protein TPSD3_01590 [Thioflexithrix psekupsensis]